MKLDNLITKMRVVIAKNSATFILSENYTLNEVIPPTSLAF